MALPTRPTQAQMQIFGTCGQTISLPVNGVIFSFTCLPSIAQPAGSEDTKPSEQQSPPQTLIVVPVDPVDLGPGQIALVTSDHVILNSNEIRPERFASVEEISPETPPYVVEVTPGTDISAADWSSAFESARDAGRPIRFRVTE
jgi:hypothetical protein